MVDIPGLIQRMKKAGFKLQYNRTGLTLIGDGDKITQEKIDYLREHKEQIIEFFKSNTSDHPITDHGSAGTIPAIPELSTDPPADPLPLYLEALTTRIQALEAEYAAAYGEPAPGEKETCRELSTKDFYPAEQRRRYNGRYEALLTIERLKRERSTAIAEGRDYWTPGPSDTILQQKDGSFVPADPAGLDQAAPAHVPEFTAKTQGLVTWFQSNERALPRTPFTLRPCVKVEEPEKFYAGLHRDISMGPGYIKAQTGSLQRDLQDLKNIVETLLQQAA